jgi:hypothetical protein
VFLLLISASLLHLFFFHDRHYSRGKGCFS